MENKTFVCSLLSLGIPLAAYAIFFLAGLAPARLGEPAVYAPLFFFNAVGFALAVLVLAGSTGKPTDTSPRMNLAVLLASTAMFATAVAVETIVHISILNKSQL
jgi:hypothetical protein